MRFAILAAGEGSRLRQEGVAEAKPLIRVGGETLLERLLRIFMHNGADDIMVICNDLRPEVNETLLRLEREGLDGRALPLRHVVRTTPSSMHSMYEMRHMLRGGPFILTTVDTFFSESEFARYVQAFARCQADGMMAVTDFVDDEKPLYVQTAPGDGGTLAVTAFLDADPRHTCTYISAGVYGLTDKALATLERCVESGQSRMRNFQRALLGDGLRLEAWPLGRVTDIDHASDIPRTVVGISRDARFSPGSVAKDEAIMREVSAHLTEQGMLCRLVSEAQLADGTALPPADAYLNMSRSPRVNRMLHEACRPCVNTPAATQLCVARKYVSGSAAPPLWLKRTDTCAQDEGDVVFCATADNLAQALRDFRRRGIAQYVAQPHYEGDVVKFYGVAGTGFFSAAPAVGTDKFGHQLPAPHGYARDDARLHAMAEQTAADMGTMVYGGDAVVSADGTMHIVDFNDWPSFSACRAEAGAAIALAATRLFTAAPAGLAAAYIFDYGATLDTRGEHWSRVIWRSYEAHAVPVTWEQFWDAYVHTERRLGQGDIIAPHHTFRDTIEKKLAMQVARLEHEGALAADGHQCGAATRRAMLDDIYAETLAVTGASRRRLHVLHARGIPMVLVSNFYGNVRTVLREFGLDHFFLEVIESARAGVRKPDVRLWQMGVDALRRALPSLKNEDIMVVGDSLEKDIEPARSLGCRTFHVTPATTDFLEPR